MAIQEKVQKLLYPTVSARLATHFPTPAVWTLILARFLTARTGSDTIHFATVKKNTISNSQSSTIKREGTHM